MPEQDWDILEAETRARIEDAQVDMKVVEEVVAEAENSASASASAPIGTTAGHRDRRCRYGSRSRGETYCYITR